jgi:sugar phosphate isomerase/epimerase
MLYLSSTAFPVDILDDPAAACLRGVAAVEISGGHAHRPWPELLTRLDALRERGIALLFHNYVPAPRRSFVLNFATADAAVLDASLELAGQALDLCARYGAPYYSFHPGYLADAAEQPDGQFAFRDDPAGGYAGTLERFHAVFGRLHAMARERGVRLALENLFMPPGRRTSLNTTLGEMRELLAPLPEDVLLLIDFGHLNVSAHYQGFDKWEYLEAVRREYGDRVAEIHLSGNDGAFDQHLPLEPGDWQLSALAAFARCPGAQGRGVHVTIESRRLDQAALHRVARLTADALAAANFPET